MARGRLNRPGRSEHGSVGPDVERWSPSGAERTGDGAAGGPGAALEHPGERQLGGSLAESQAHRLGDAVEQRDGERAPLDDDLVARCVDGGADVVAPRYQDAEVDEQAAVAVLGEPGQGAGLRDPAAV